MDRISSKQLRQEVFKKLDTNGNGKIDADEAKMASIFGMKVGETKVPKKDFNEHKAQNFLDAVNNGEEFVFGAKISAGDKTTVENCYNCHLDENIKEFSVGDNANLVMQSGGNNTGIVGDNNTVHREGEPEVAPSTNVEECFDCDITQTVEHEDIPGDLNVVIQDAGKGNVAIIGDNQEVSVESVQSNPGEVIENCVECEISTETFVVSEAGENTKIIAQNGDGNTAVIGDGNVLDTTPTNYALQNGEFPAEAKEILKKHGLDQEALKSADFDMITKIVNDEGVEQLIITSSSNPAYKLITSADNKNSAKTSFKIEDGTLHVENFAGKLEVADDGADVHEVVITNCPDIEVTNKSMSASLRQVFVPKADHLSPEARRTLDKLGVPSAEVVKSDFDKLTVTTPPFRSNQASDIDLSSSKHGFNLKTDSGRSNRALELSYNSLKHKLHVKSYNGELYINDDGASEHEVEFMNSGMAMYNYTGKPNHLHQLAMNVNGKLQNDDSRISYFTETHEDTWTQDRVEDINVKLWKLSGGSHGATRHRGASRVMDGGVEITGKFVRSGTPHVSGRNWQETTETIGHYVKTSDAVTLKPGAHNYRPATKTVDGEQIREVNEFLQDDHKKIPTYKLSREHGDKGMFIVPKSVNYSDGIGNYPAVDGKMSDEARTVLHDIFKMDAQKFEDVGFDNFEVVQSDNGPVLKFSSSSNGIEFEMDSNWVPYLRNRMSITQEKDGSLKFDNVIGRVSYNNPGIESSHVTITDSELKLENKTGRQMIIDTNSQVDLEYSTTTNSDVVRYYSPLSTDQIVRVLGAGDHKLVEGKFVERTEGINSKALEKTVLIERQSAAEIIMSRRNPEGPTPATPPSANPEKPKSVIVVQNGDANLAVVGNGNIINGKLTRNVAVALEQEYNIDARTFAGAGFRNVSVVTEDGVETIVFSNNNGEQLSITAEDARLLASQIKIKYNKSEGLQLENFIGKVVTNGTRIKGKNVSATVSDISGNHPKLRGFGGNDAIYEFTVVDEDGNIIDIIDETKRKG